MSGAPEAVRCPDCGAELVSEPGLPRLCPQCLLSLALQQSPAASPGGDGGSDPEALTVDRPTPGRILGERYQIRELLGRGGMGEVFRAFDLKLRVDVALKAVRAEKTESERAREMLRQEVRSAREVVSPNVCRIFDLVAEDGQELVSMEYVDGETLGETLKQRGPLSLAEAREIASQFLSGLEAIHQAGLVHRDFKPENVMLTRAGRVVVMDFGLAKARTQGGTGTIAGTPAYMAPEQARGDAVDARADVFAAGVVLAEMLSVGGSGVHEARQGLWRALRETPPRVPEGPWASVLRMALSPIPGERPASARALSRALEEATLRLPEFEELRPYPGLSSFTEADAEYFHGREQEVEAVLKKLKRPRLLGLAGPSGAGKSSFLRAGLLPVLPATWTAVITTPGTRPFQALAQTLLPHFAQDMAAMQDFLRFEEPDVSTALVTRWRRRHEHALLIVDQFEELFTQNPKDVQAAFAALLGRLVLEADAHVVVSLRDDFLIHCHGHEALAPILSELALLGPLAENGLRRALVQPALSCGYRFEDEALVEEMLAAVRGERGALPLIAFAASRLWDLRDRERGLLTWEAYRQIGGVAGALAQHAEATLERIGAPRTPLVRELFRNLVTAQGTRAVREREELLSVFAEAADGARATAKTGARPVAAMPEWRRTDAEDVLRALVDARLLSMYDRSDESGESHAQVEIVHESLLSAWPRLVRWQTQDADGAQLRDQLRQAAQAWHDRGRPEDLLWTGTAYRDLALWRERSAGGLRATEQAFADAAARLNGRRRRRRRLAAATVVIAAAAVAITMSVLWQRADASRQRAESAALRAEASRLLAFAQLERESYPTAALAWAIRSLELADTREARLFALGILQSALVATHAKPPAGDADGLEPLAPVFSRNGEWLAVGGYRRVLLLHQDGRPSRALGDYPAAGFSVVAPIFSAAGDRVIGGRQGDIRAWSLADGRQLWRKQGPPGTTYPEPWPEGFLTATLAGSRLLVHAWPPDGGEPRLLGELAGVTSFYHRGSHLAYRNGRQVLVRDLRRWDSPTRVAEMAVETGGVAISSDGSVVAASDGKDEIRVWATTGNGFRPLRMFQAPGTRTVTLDREGRRLLASGVQEGAAVGRVFDLRSPAGAEPLVLRRSDIDFFSGADFDATGRWLATGHGDATSLWSLGGPRPQVLRAGPGVNSLAFAPDGRTLVSAGGQFVRAWSLEHEIAESGRVLLEARLAFPGIVMHPSSPTVAVVGRGGQAFLVPLAGGTPETLGGFSERASLGSVALVDGGRLVAAAPFASPREEKLVRIWDAETRAVRTIGPLPGAGEGFVGGIRVRAVGADHLVAGVFGHGLVRIGVRDGSQTLLAEKIDWLLDASPDGRFVLACSMAADESTCPPVRVELERGGVTPLDAFGPYASTAAFDASGSLIATGDGQGTVRVGRVSGGEVHVLLGHKGLIRSVAFAPDGRWLASAGNDGTIRLWPVPDVTKPPLHTRPHAELMAVLRSHTNLRAVPDPESATGYKLEPGPFPGWATLPDW